MQKKLSKQLLLTLAFTAPFIIGYLYLTYRNRKKRAIEGKKDPLTNVIHKSSETAKEEKIPLALALGYKIDGNENFKKGEYQAATDNYTEAITICPPDKKEDLATFYNNRAAAYFHMGKYQETIDDCSDALKLKNKAYPKALYRRALAYESMEKFEESFTDLTCVCFLEQFSISETLQVADRVLKKLSQEKSKKCVNDRKPQMPATKFIQSYISSFHHDPFFNMDAKEQSLHSHKNSPDSENKSVLEMPAEEHNPGLEPTDQDTTYNSTVEDLNLTPAPLSNASFDGADFEEITDLLNRNEYGEVVKECDRLLDKYRLSLETQPGQNQASKGELLEKKHLVLLLRATFNLLAGAMEEAKSDLDTILSAIQAVDDASDPDALGSHLYVSEERFKANVYIKYASYLTQEADTEGAAKYFDKAIQIDPDNCDAHYHKAQFHTLFGDFEDALRSFDKSLALSPTPFPLAKVQRDYTAFKVGITPPGTTTADLNPLAGGGAGLSSAPPPPMFPAALMGPSALKEAQSLLARGLERTVQEFPDCSEAHVFLAQAYCDIMKSDSAQREFDRALEIDPQNFTVYVHMALLALQSSNDVDKAMTLVKKALEIEPKCEFAYETLGTIEMQRNNPSGALDNFEKALALVKTEFEMAHLIAMMETVRAQQKAIEILGNNVLPGLFGR